MSFLRQNIPSNTSNTNKNPETILEQSNETSSETIIPISPVTDIESQTSSPTDSIALQGEIGSSIIYFLSSSTASTASYVVKNGGKILMCTSDSYFASTIGASLGGFAIGGFGAIIADRLIGKPYAVSNFTPWFGGLSAVGTSLIYNGLSCYTGLPSWAPPVIATGLAMTPIAVKKVYDCLSKNRFSLWNQASNTNRFLSVNPEQERLVNSPTMLRK